MLGQLVAHLRVQVRREGLPLIVGQGEQDLDEVHSEASDKPPAARFSFSESWIRGSRGRRSIAFRLACASLAREREAL